MVTRAACVAAVVVVVCAQRKHDQAIKLYQAQLRRDPHNHEVMMALGAVRVSHHHHPHVSHHSHVSRPTTSTITCGASL